MEVFKPKRDLNCLAKFKAILRRWLRDFCTSMSQTRVLSSAKCTSSNTFVGWAEQPNETTLKYVAGKSYLFSEDVTLYAVWQANITAYAVTYNTNGGSPANIAPVTIASGASITLPSIDGNGFQQEAEITYEVYIALEDCRRHEQRQQRSFERHIERVKLTEGQIAEHIQTPPEPLEESVDATVTFQAALATLTDTQRRRFLLYHEYGLSYEQIAVVEGCKFQVIARSIAAAIAKLKNFFEERGEKRGSECGID